jgi:hypothetical protein
VNICPIQNGLKQRRCFITIAFNFTLEYVIRKVHENKEKMELDGMHQLLIYADDIYLLVENINITKKK